MVVLLDAGNTNVKLAYVTDDDEIKRLTLADFYQSIKSVDKLIYGSVNDSSELKEFLTACIDNNITVKKVEVTPSFNNLICGYNVVANLGVDRWLATIGARLTYSENILIIVDAGTAITLDICINQEHKGGWIAPGLMLMQQSIIDKAPGVFTNESINSEIFGTDTPSALFHGSLYALVAMIEKGVELAKKLANEDECSLNIILTGGDAAILNSHLSLNSDVNHDLVFLGLQQFI